MDARYDFTLTIFSAAEAEKITGLPQATQRDWRRRGFLPAIKGKAKFTVFDLARMLLMENLSTEMGMTAATMVADLASATVAAEALRVKTSVSGLPEGFSSETLHLEICAYFDQVARTEKFLILWAGGLYVSFDDDLASAFAGRPKTIFGPEANPEDPIGRMLAIKGGALDHTDVQTADEDELVARLQYGPVNVFNLRQFGAELIPNLGPDSPIRRPLVSATPMENAP